MNDSYIFNVTFYNFTATYPSYGHCEYQQLGPVGVVKQLGNMLFSIATAAEGLFGLITARKVNTMSRYLFCLLFGYGIMSACHHGTLWLGFKKTAGAILNLMQAIIIASLANTLRFPPFYDICTDIVSDIALLTFGIYPLIAHVLGSSHDNPWVGWLTFDGIWAVVLIVLIVIFVERKKFKHYDLCPEIFYVIFYAAGCCIIAYTFWLLDRFACSFPVAVIQSHGWWHIFMGLCFYYLTVLNAYLHAYYSRAHPVVVRWPKQGCCILFVYVKWDVDLEDDKTESTEMTSPNNIQREHVNEGYEVTENEH